MRKLLYNIGKLWGLDNSPGNFVSGSEMSRVDALENAWILIENGRIAAFGNGEMPQADTKEDLLGMEVLPGFVDSHTHAVFATERSDEFVMRIRGAGYEEIAKAGGGILNSANKLRAMDE
jgi:imidazolonepropionase